MGTVTVSDETPLAQPVSLVRHEKERLILLYRAAKGDPKLVLKIVEL